MKNINKIIYTLSILASVFLVVGAWKHWLPTTEVEVFGFITGAICVWLTVKENIWNWPIGIANSAFFLVLFLKSKLFADSSLQVVYIVLGFLGWYWWLHGGKNRTELSISRVSMKTFTILAIITIGATYAMTIYLRTIHDTAPFWDAFTTVISLVAQYLLTKKIIENWYVWILADIIYIPLYFYKELYLTGIVYIVFMAMCVRGLVEWKQTLVKIEKI